MNSSRPMKNRLRKAAVLPVTWSRPGGQRTIADVIVLARVQRVDRDSDPAARPAATATTIVSPIARRCARMNAATMPETAAGKTTRRLVVTLARPQPVRGLAQALRHRAHRVLGDRGDERDDQDADADPARPAC